VTNQRRIESRLLSSAWEPQSTSACPPRAARRPRLASRAAPLAADARTGRSPTRDGGRMPPDANRCVIFCAILGSETLLLLGCMAHLFSCMLSNRTLFALSIYRRRGCASESARSPDIEMPGTTGRQKKPTWPKTRRSSTTSAYSLTSLPPLRAALYLVIRRDPVQGAMRSTQLRRR
jgi:hypothetical protein